MLQLWERRKTSWQQRFPWLDFSAGSSAEPSGVGCKICCAGLAALDHLPKDALKHIDYRCSFATYRISGTSMQPANFVRHQASVSHRALEQHSCSASLAYFAPSQLDFKAVLAALRKGENHTVYFSGTRFAKMLKSLANAKRLCIQALALSAISFSIAQDVRQGQLVISFSASDVTLVKYTGVLGQVHLTQGFGLSAQGILEGTIWVLHQVCMNGNDEINQQALSALLAKVELFSADGASDEQLAGQLLGGLFPNMLHRVRDKAHGTQRIISRCWQADPQLRAIADELVLGPNAIAQRIRWSPLFKSRFNRFVADATQSQKSRIADLACAKHRFATIAKPFGRAVLYFGPLVRTAQTILDERGPQSAEGRDARSFLVSLTEERAILLAMMADCSDETLTLLHFFDADDYDKASMTAELTEFLVRVTWLFDQRGALTVTTGYTKFMLESLKTARTIFVDAKPKMLGGPMQVKPQMLDRCFQVMSNWVELARHTVRADMPEFEMLQLFRAFRLTGVTTDDMAANLTTLGKLFKLNTANLMAQFHDYRPMAKKWADQGMETEDAWRRALADVRARPRALSVHPYHDLSQILARYVAWGGSTTGIERVFSKANMVSHSARGDVSEHRLSDEVLLLQPCPHDDDVCILAQEEWARMSGPPRTSTISQRLHKGLPQEKQVNPHSEAQFIKRRRVEVSTAASSSSVNAADATQPQGRVVGMGGWQDLRS